MKAKLTYFGALKLVLKIAFLGLCSSFLVKFYLHPEHWVNAEVGLLFTLEMIVVAFPASILVWIITWALGLLFSTLSYWQYIELIFFFVSVVLIGYWQWFILLPKIWMRLQMKKQAKGGNNWGQSKNSKK